MKNIMEHVEIIGEIPVFMIFLNEKSNPNENKRNITPMSPHILMLVLSTTDMIYGMCGLTIKPATTYPSTNGCFSFLKTMVTTPATTRMRARSFIK